MLIQKTVKVPIHHATMRGKLCILDRLTARLTFGVRLWSGLIEKHGITTRKELQRLEPHVTVSRYPVKVGGKWVTPAGRYRKEDAEKAMKYAQGIVHIAEQWARGDFLQPIEKQKEE